MDAVRDARIRASRQTRGRQIEVAQCTPARARDARAGERPPDLTREKRAGGASRRTAAGHVRISIYSSCVHIGAFGYSAPECHRIFIVHIAPVSARAEPRSKFRSAL